MRIRHVVWLLSLLLLPAASANPAPPPPLDVEIGYLGRDYPEPLPLSLVEPVIADQGLQGARLGLSDNLATGRFLKQSYRLTEKISPRNGDIAADAKALLLTTRLLVADLEPADLLRVADLPEARDAIIINVRSSNDDLRGKDCRKNVFHVAPSWQMRADALAQYLVWKRWNQWFLLRGDATDDIDYAAAMKRSAAKFGGKITQERTIVFDPGNRNSETGHQQIQTQIPMRTQSPPPHDVVMVADTEDNFGDYLMWRTSAPKPVAGTQGLMAVAWSPLYEEYGGIQLQTRFRSKVQRPMTERDYMAWLAVRAFGETVTRSAATDLSGWREYLLSKQFQLAGFKGQAMSFRSWDRQLRQPIILTGPRSLVSMSPQEGFLHPEFLTDTLGVDAPETACKVPG